MMQVFLDILSSRWMDGDRVSRRGKERNFLEEGETKEKNEGRDVVQRRIAFARRQRERTGVDSPRIAKQEIRIGRFLRKSGGTKLENAATGRGLTRPGQ